MSDGQLNVQEKNGSSTLGQIVWRLVTSAVVLAITAFFTPGFSINNIWTLAIAAIVLTAMDYLITKFTGLHASSFGRGFVGFVLAVATLYITQFFVAGYTISWVAAIVGALIYGVVDYFIPGNQSV
ncbi:MAG TPA: phage holin family protein [Candidatus Merdicola faecigallinarum]|uniref:Phage holin family protein n=1 Tax=Candidatus Merdicola faecigallinarum TaxID=2840862 RepID=A0A9D1M0M0_9FIRM|nr:phage holin family protein [Candidatus Merdicola faecigallinarum]